MMIREDEVFYVALDSRNKEEQEKSEALTLDRLLFLVDENTLVRLGLGLIETLRRQREECSGTEGSEKDQNGYLGGFTNYLRQR